MERKKLCYTPRRRKFHGNKYSKGQDVVSSDTASASRSDQNQNNTVPRSMDSASFAKLKKTTDHVDFNFDDKLTGFRFIHCQLLVDFVKEFLCPHCKQPLGSDPVQSSVNEIRTDLASQLDFHCACGQVRSFKTSNLVNKVYEVNRRFPLAMFAIGCNQQKGRRFLGNMNMPSSLHSNTWANHREQIRKASEAVAELSMDTAAEEARAAAGTGDITISGDRTYQRHGFQSKNAVFTALTVNGKASKVLDTEVLSNHCDACKKQEKKIDGRELEEWKRNHKGVQKKCDKNHEGSAASMEPAGAEVVFRRSVQRHQLRYINFLGDGDSKTYTTLKNANIYPVAINKLECCGHVQKRMGRQLTNKVTENKNKVFPRDNNKTTKGIGGKGGLTKKAILRIQGHYGAAIRNNSNNLVEMKKAIWAIFEHRSGQHDNCGQWCPSKTGRGDPNVNVLPSHVLTAIRPVFETLSQDSLLAKCLHGGSQNTNESFHNLIWERCPKTCFVGRKRLCLVVADATIVYNDGECGRLNIFQRLGFEAGLWTRLCFQELDKSRVKAGQIQATEAAQRARRDRSLQAAAGNEGNREEFYLAGAHE